MKQIFDKNNIIKGITTIKENDKLYICFDKECLSNNNQLILEKISYAYSEIIFIVYESSLNQKNKQMYLNILTNICLL